MSIEGRNLQVGDYALTDFNGVGMKMVLIIQRRDARWHSQSGVQFCVSPPLKGGVEGTFYDADWFEPCPMEVA